MASEPEAPKTNGTPMKAMDGLQNVAAGLGTARDKRSYSEYAPVLPQSQMQLENLFRSSWLGRRIVTTVADDMTRAWCKLGWDGYDDSDNAKAVERAETAFALRKSVNSAIRWGRLYGGAVILPVIRGELDLSKPLEIETLQKRSLIRLQIFDRHEVASTGEISDKDADLESDNFGLPTFYTLAGSSRRIHWSRLVRFGGQELPRLLFQQNGHWDDSVLQSPIDSVKDYETATHGTASMIWEASVDILKLAGLADQLSVAGGEAKVIARLLSAMTMKSFNRTLVLDKDTEDFEQKSISFGGINEVIGNFVVDLCGAADIPATRLFGMSPGGLNATGESDLRNYYDHVRARQETNLQPQLERLYQILIRSTLGKMPENFTMVFNSLWQVSDKERTDIAKVQAETDAIYLREGVLTEPAVARELLDRGTYTTMEDADVELVEELAAEAHELAKKAALNPPPPPQKGLPPVPEDPPDGKPKPDEAADE